MAVDVTRRQAVMTRSQKLGHCVCNPKAPCPCPALLEYNVCPCAGEKMPVKKGRVALTRHVRKAGCASKIGQADLARVLGKLPAVEDPRVLLGTAAGDDAGIFQIDADTALVQTVDVFTPCVDDPYLFGQIAAANSVSDVYAMGGTPLSALSIIGFPIDDLDSGVMEAMLRGGVDKLNEANCPVIGGHSINDEEIKLGFAVTGRLHPKQVVERDCAEAGDVLVLTKPLGTGMVAFAAQLGLVSEAVLDEVGHWMAALNRDAAELMVECGVHACTDVTGFGLAGHLVAMTRGSGVNAEIDLSATPVFAMVPECIEHAVFGGAVDRNQAFAMDWVEVAEGADASSLPVIYDAQTSGGLLLSMREADGLAFVDAMEARGHEAVAIIGRVREKDRDEGRVIVVNGELNRMIGTREDIDMTKDVSKPAEEAPCCCGPVEEVSCCDSEAESSACCEDEAAPEVADSLPIFREFMKAANAPGLIDGRSKKLMAIILSIAHHCHPCLKIHLQGAVKMGIGKAEIDEAANLAIAFGGCTAMMFYKEVCDELGV